MTVLNQTPSAFCQLMQADASEPELGDALALRQVIFGGEALELRAAGALVSAARRACAALVNMYGITETTVHVSYLALDRATASADARQPDRRGRSRTCGVYVLDGGLQPVPAGVAGRAVRRGARAGARLPGPAGLTAERFVADPFGPPGAGCTAPATWRAGAPDGVLEFLGRADEQVKIRGFRIELGEIEAALARHAGVAQAAVVAREDQPGDKRLVAYVVAAAGERADPAALRAHVAATPAGLHGAGGVRAAGRLPLTPNGKLDRRALPAPDLTPATRAVRRARRRRRSCAALFAEVLGLERVGIDDNFFALGGDSIMSIQLVSRARQAGLVITPRAVFQHQTVAALAAAATLVPRRPASALPDIAVGAVAGDADHALAARARRADRALQPGDAAAGAGGPARGCIWSAALQALLEHHDALRLRLDCRAKAASGAGDRACRRGRGERLPAAGRCLRACADAALQRCIGEQAQAAERRLAPAAGHDGAGGVVRRRRATRPAGCC